MHDEVKRLLLPKDSLRCSFRELISSSFKSASSPRMKVDGKFGNSFSPFSDNNTTGCGKAHNISERFLKWIVMPGLVSTGPSLPLDLINAFLISAAVERSSGFRYCMLFPHK